MNGVVIRGVDDRGNGDGDGMSKKAPRTRCPECGQMVLMYFSKMQNTTCIKGHCKPGTDPKKSIGCDCLGSYRPVRSELLGELK